MTQEQLKQAVEYWNKKDRKCMPQDQLKKVVDDYVNANNVCALATGTGDYVRCTPLEYSYHDGKFWIFSEGGRKVYRACPK